MVPRLIYICATISTLFFGEFASGDGGYIGCFKDKPDRRLASDSVTSNQMTVEYCIKFCNSGGFKYAGVQCSSQCFCGDSYSERDRLPESSCNRPCAGDQQQTCGGSWRNSVYESASDSSTTTSDLCCCPPIYNTEINMTNELKEKLQEIKTKLIGFKNSTSRSNRRLFSAPDTRLTAAVTGWIFGTVFLGTMILFIVLLDLAPIPCRVKII